MVFRDLSCLLVIPLTIEKDVLGAVLVNYLKLTHIAFVITRANELFDAVTSKLNFSNIGGILIFAIKQGRLNATRENELNCCHAAIIAFGTDRLQL